MIKTISTEFSLPPDKIKAVLTLLSEGNTIPFIARYRKEMTGGIDDHTLREIKQRADYLEKLQQRRQEVQQNINEQGKLSQQLAHNIASASTLAQLEDIYRPFKQKKSTRATKAKDKGLEPLATLIFEQVTGITDELLKHFLAPQHELETVEDCLAGSRDIIAEWISDNAQLREYIRKTTFKKGSIIVSAKDNVNDTPYQNYADYQEALQSIPAHRILAINRGEKEGFLSVRINFPMTDILNSYGNKLVKINSASKGIMDDVIADALKRLVLPSMEREVRSTLKERAESQAIKVFGRNLHQLLLQAPVMDHKILALDPGFRTGCKVAAVDASGHLLATTTIYPTAPHNKTEQASNTLLDLIAQHQINLITIGNGTASRETEQFVADLINQHNLNLSYTIVNEAGASVYSASPVAQQEFPHLDVSLRSAVSIARRLQDPLAELVKIDAKSIGVGQYQHDVNQKSLTASLTGVVESCVNKVGVNLNTASVQLLTYISGLTPSVCKKIISYREENGDFTSRKELKEISGLGAKAFEQCAGFLRLPQAKNPLDNTAVHPESYSVVNSLENVTGTNLADILGNTSILNNLNIESTAQKLNIGIPTLKDIIAELKKPGRDPRQGNFTAPFRQDVLELKDLAPGMQLQGVVRNVVDFGAFVDIGVHQDGLIHISQLSHKYVKHPLDVLDVGDAVNVTVLEVDTKRGRISLTLLEPKTD